MWITPLTTHCVWHKAFPTTLPTPPITPPTVEPTPPTTPPTIVPTPPITPPTTPPRPPINPPIGSSNPSPEIDFSSFLSSFLKFFMIKILYD
ncbi:hypothetical protein EG351_04375 [Chryseobacterium bernardetii]|nr:hypothetical protein EG351_04375 [Chryseobacterium bernardetii]